MKHYMELVPTLSCEGKFTLGNGTTITFDDTRLWEVLFGGDQLTVARIRGTQTLRDTEESPGDRLEGIIPVVEDWHTRMTFLRVQQSTIIICACMHACNNYTLECCNKLFMFVATACLGASL